MDLDESLRVEEVSEKVTDGVLKRKHSLVRLCLRNAGELMTFRFCDTTHSEVDNTVVQTRVEEDALVLYLLVRGDLSLGSVSVFNAERQTTVQARDQVDLIDTSVDFTKQHGIH